MRSLRLDSVPFLRWILDNNLVSVHKAETKCYKLDVWRKYCPGGYSHILGILFRCKGIQNIKALVYKATVPLYRKCMYSELKSKMRERREGMQEIG